MKRGIKLALLVLTAAAVAAAQDGAGSIQGTVIDSVSRQPVKRATVTIRFFGLQPGTSPGSAQTTVTDAAGAFAFDNLAAGKYNLRVEHQNYPQTRMGGTHKTLDVAANDTPTTVTVELVPGAAISGHIIDEDGDPMNGCIVQPHPANNFNAGIPMLRIPMSHQDGSYRIYGIPPGKYIITAQCSQSVFQPRPLSAGPDPPPTAAYPRLFYPAATDAKSAQVMDLAASAEKSGVDFQMRPVPVTTIHGAVIAGSADWRGRTDLRVQLAPVERGPNAFGYAGSQVNPKDGTFELKQVFSGSYRLAVFSQDFSRGIGHNASNRVGAVMRVDVTDKPLDVSVQLNRAMDVSGSVEMGSSGTDPANQITLTQLSFQLRSDAQFGPQPPLAQVNEDGTFTLKSVLPGDWRIHLVAPLGFIKSAWLGNDDVTNRPMDLTSGSAPPLRIVVSTNTGTLEGTAPPGKVVFATNIDDGFGGSAGRFPDSSGRFTFTGLSPGRYRVVLGNPGEPPSDQGGKEITLGEGETATVDLTPEAQPSQ